MADLAAVPSEWHGHLGADCFRALPSFTFLNTREAAGTVPCRHRTRSCRRHHRIEEEDDGRLVARPPRDSGCRPFAITPEERLVWRIDLPGLMAELAVALTLEGPSEVLTPTLWRIGTVTKLHVPIFLSFARTVSDHVQNVAFVAARRPERPVFFVPSASSALQPVDDALKACGGRLGVLGDFVAPDPKGGLTAILELSERWSDLEREPERATRKLRLPEGADWKHLVVTLLDNGNISISHREGSPNATYTRRELGFESQHGRESKDWLTFQAAVHVGYIPEPSVGTDRDEDTRSRVRSITKKLAAVTGIEGTAFALGDGAEHAPRRRNAGRGYWPLFKLRAESDRVRRGAARLGNSPSDPDDFPDERD
ncbi:MAG: hypothetical protein ACAH89_04265 [Rariglobus sp.]